MSKRKTCIRCLKRKAISRFRFRDDTESYRGACRLCENLYCRHWRKTHRKEVYAYENTPQRKIANRLRQRLNKALKEDRSEHAEEYLGCSFAEFKEYLETQFYKNPKTKSMMSWKNYGKYWHIDHIIPLAYFDLTDESQVVQAFHYTNLQPLWAEENLSKGSKCEI